MLCPISRSRFGLQNTCASCLGTVLRRDLGKQRLRQTGLIAAEGPGQVRNINSAAKGPSPLISDTKNIPDFVSTLSGNPPETKRTPPSNKSNRIARRAGKRLQKVQTGAQDGISLPPLDDQRDKIKPDDIQDPKASIKPHPSIPRKKKKKNKIAASSSPSRVVRSTSSTPLKVFESAKAVETPRTKCTPDSSSQPESTKKQKQKQVPMIRRTHPEAKTPDLQRLIAKSHILRLNKQGGLSDSDKLQIMEHFRRSMEDKALAEVVAFTKRRTLPKASPTTKAAVSRKRSLLFGKEDAVDSGALKGFKPLASPMANPSIKPIEKSSSLTAYEIQTIEARKLNLVPLEVSQPPVPKLSYGLERVLFNPGVYHLRDPRSRVFNFDPYLQSIMPIRDFDFSALKEYITSSRDKTLISTAAAENKKYSGSTSSMTSALAHFHFLLSQWRPVNTSTLSQGFPSEYQTFTSIQRAPSAIFLRWRDGTYAIDADKQFDTANILMMLGKSMEKLLTLNTDEFEKYRKLNSSQISEEERNESESYHYTTMGDFLMRSQLDAYDPRLPGTGMFDLKTRAVVSIRMDAKNYENGLGYEIRSRHGEFESYEREYYDMIRSAFLKYSLQVRMGRMDGIFVAFHNTERIFGFQYISLPEMDFALHGTDNTIIGDTEFKISLELMNRVLDRATAKYPGRSLRLHFETREGVAPFMYIFAEPVSEDEIDKIQATNKAEIAEFERCALGLEHVEEVDDATAEWGTLQAKVEKTMERDELGVVDELDASRDSVNVEDISVGVDQDEVERQVNQLLCEMGVNVGQGRDDAEKLGGRGGVGEAEEEYEEYEHEYDKGSVNGKEERDEEERRSYTDRSPVGDSDLVRDLELGADAADAHKPRANLMPYDSGLMTEESHQVGMLTSELEDVESDTVRHVTDTKTALASQTNTNIDTPERSAGTDVKDDVAILSVKQDPTELLAMTLTIRNKINGRYLPRPSNIDSDDDWDVEYALAEVPQIEKALTLYKASQKRRAASLADKSEANNQFVNSYMNTLHQLSKKGRQWRKEQDRIDEAEPFKILPKIPIEGEVEDTE